MAVPNMIVTLVANTTKYASGLRKAAGQTKSFGDVAQFAFKSAAAAVVSVGVALARAIPAFANMGAESRKADLQLKFMLENMQGISIATDATVKRLADYADKVSKATGLDDEAIKAVQKKILVFKSLRKSAGDLGGTFDRTTKAAIDLAAAGFGTAEANAVKLGRMLENPIKSLNAMSKAGITFTDTEKRKITKLVESGKLLKAQDLILKSIEKRVGGLAEKSATPFDRMVQQFQDIGDTIGEAMLPSLEDMNTEISKWLSTDEGKQDLADIVDAFVTMAGAIRDAVKFLKQVKGWLDKISKEMAKLFPEGSWTGTVWTPWNTSAVSGSGNPSAPGGPARRSKAPAASAGVVINFNTPVDSVSAGREVARVLADYQRVRGMA